MDFTECAIDFEFACSHGFTKMDFWKYVSTGYLNEEDKKAYEEWKAAHSNNERQRIN